jgi:hypothetical protein
LGAAGKTFCREAFAEYDGWGRAELELLRLAGRALDVGASAQKQITADGVLLRTSTGRTYPNPLLKIDRAASSQFASLIRSLRLDMLSARKPADRDADREDRELAALLAIK